jgi:hypothetical protein
LGDKWFDRNFIRNNRNFIYTGGIIDFILAAALGIWLNGKDLSWDLWFVSLVCALTVRGICAAIKKQYSTIAYITVALLTFYWFVGSWALGTILHNATPLEPVPSHIIALVFTVLGIVWHIRFVQRRKR